MRKYAFRKWDIVRARSVLLGYTRDGETVILPTDEESIVGRVIGFGSSAGHDWYKVASGGDVYNCRDDELELVRRGPAGRDFPPIDENEIERDLLIWKPMSSDPPKDAECLAVWRRTDGALREHVLLWDGEKWIMRMDSGEISIEREMVAAWTLWDWPEIPEIGPDADIYQKSDGEEGVRDASDDDQDDGPGRD